MRNKLFLPAIAAALALMASCSKTPIDAEGKDPAADDKTPPTTVTAMRTEEAFPGASGPWQSMVIAGDTLHYQVINGQNVMEGDILLPGAAAQLDTGRMATESTGVTSPDRKWRNGNVYYVIDPSLPDISRVTYAMQHWERYTSIRFHKRTTQANYVYFTDGGGCSSYVGKIGGRQQISIGTGCNIGSTIHEIGHAVGLYHEQSRSDRNESIKIHWDQIEAGKENNFRTWKARGEDGFDLGNGINFQSIMMYGPYSFAKGTKPTITKKDGSIYDWQRSVLSQRDINAVKHMYQ